MLAAAASAACTNLQLPHFEPGLALDQLAQGVTVAFSAFETIWLAVLNHERFAATDLSALRLVVNVAVPASLRAMQERLPTATQISCFGSTETAGFACLGVAGDTLERATTTSGRPLRDIEVRVVDPETGAELPPASPASSSCGARRGSCGYHEDPEATAATIDADGWYHSGDLGRKDARGASRSPAG